LLMPWGTK